MCTDHKLIQTTQTGYNDSQVREAIQSTLNNEALTVKPGFQYYTLASLISQSRSSVYYIPLVAIPNHQV